MIDTEIRFPLWKNGKSFPTYLPATGVQSWLLKMREAMLL